MNRNYLYEQRDKWRAKLAQLEQRFSASKGVGGDCLRVRDQIDAVREHLGRLDALIDG